MKVVCRERSRYERSEQAVKNKTPPRVELPLSIKQNATDDSEHHRDCQQRRRTGNMDQLIRLRRLGHKQTPRVQVGKEVSDGLARDLCERAFRLEVGEA